MITTILLQILFALVYQNFLEWVLHKYILHDLGKKKNSLVSYHWKRHHKIVRNNNYKDEDYLLPWYKINSKSKELLGLGLLVLIHLPIIFYYPIVYFVMLIGTVAYYQIHKKSHMSPQWGKKYFRWHYDHHMVGNQSHNWCVCFPLMDYVFGTRKK